MHSEELRRQLSAVGQRIREIRGTRTQAEIAERLRMTVPNYQAIEHGWRNLTIESLMRIARALDVRIAALFAAPRSPKPKRGRPRNRTPRATRSG